jgi:peptidoglycan LD-endopeptidase CwlK
VATRIGLHNSSVSTVTTASAVDDRSAKNIATLLPAAQSKAREWLAKCLAEGIHVKIIQGTRTHEEQAAVYA